MNVAQGRVSVLIPTFESAHWLTRSMESLLAQSFEHWECVVVDDGSTDDTDEVVARYLSDARFRYHRLDVNGGLGAALNLALDLTSGEYVTYLPADDQIRLDHLETLRALLAGNPDTVLAFSGVESRVRVLKTEGVQDNTSTGQIDGEPLQLVQVMHRRSGDRWMERSELVTDDLDRMYWSKLHAHGAFAGTGLITARWTDHPLQRHKVIREHVGGINPYRRRYGVSQPLRYHTTRGSFTDEGPLYARLRDRPDSPPAPDPLTILIVGELAFNPERILALEERGHKLHGLWTPDGHWFQCVGPVPFGHITDLPATGWKAAIRDLRPDVIYGLLNWQAVPFAHEVMTACPEIPFVWHFKEEPFECMSNGTWPQLYDLMTRTAGQLHTNPLTLEWFDRVLGDPSERHAAVLDGDLPPAVWFEGEPSPLLSDGDGELHTVVTGNLDLVGPETMADLAGHHIHLHMYGDFYRIRIGGKIAAMQEVAPRHFHIHPQVGPQDWVRELSRYDAGWLHLVPSRNGGDLTWASWHDLNIPARVPVLMAAGVPLIDADNEGHLAATQNLIRERGIGLLYKDAATLAASLQDRAAMAAMRKRVWQQRLEFSFDHHADRLVDFLRASIARRHAATAKPQTPLVSGLLTGLKRAAREAAGPHADPQDRSTAVEGASAG